MIEGIFTGNHGPILMLEYHPLYELPHNIDRAWFVTIGFIYNWL